MTSFHFIKKEETNIHQNTLLLYDFISFFSSSAFWFIWNFNKLPVPITWLKINKRMKGKVFLIFFFSFPYIYWTSFFIIVSCMCLYLCVYVKHQHMLCPWIITSEWEKKKKRMIELWQNETMQHSTSSCTRSSYY